MGQKNFSGEEEGHEIMGMGWDRENSMGMEWGWEKFLTLGGYGAVYFTTSLSNQNVKPLSGLLLGKICDLFHTKTYQFRHRDLH